MKASDLLKTLTTVDPPAGSSDSPPQQAGVSDFLRVQSLANFGAMTGAITAAWHGLQTIMPSASALWVPYVFAAMWGIISVLISLDGLKLNSGGSLKLKLGTVLGAIFIAAINSLVLAGAVVGTNLVTAQQS